MKDHELPIWGTVVGVVRSGVVRSGVVRNYCRLRCAWGLQSPLRGLSCISGTASCRSGVMGSVWLGLVWLGMVWYGKFAASFGRSPNTAEWPYVPLRGSWTIFCNHICGMWNTRCYFIVSNLASCLLFPTKAVHLYIATCVLTDYVTFPHCTYSAYFVLQTLQLSIRSYHDFYYAVLSLAFPPVGEYILYNHYCQLYICLFFCCGIQGFRPLGFMLLLYGCAVDGLL